MYEIFEHTADLGLRIEAGNLEALFEDAAQGLLSMLVANLDDVRPVVEKSYQLEGDERELLLFDWLNELLYTFESEHLLLAVFDVAIEQPGPDRWKLTATARGEAVDDSRHSMEHEVKAITYHGLRVEQRDELWVAEVIVDI